EVGPVVDVGPLIPQSAIGFEVLVHRPATNALAELLHDADGLFGCERAHRAAAPVAGQAVLDGGSQRSLVVRSVRDRDRVVLAERQINIDELAACSIEPLPRCRDSLVPVLDRLDALLGEANQRDVARHALPPYISRQVPCADRLIAWCMRRSALTFSRRSST